LKHPHPEKIYVTRDVLQLERKRFSVITVSGSLVCRRGSSLQKGKIVAVNPQREGDYDKTEGGQIFIRP
jgi:hypothetical protein